MKRHTASPAVLRALLALAVAVVIFGGLDVRASHAQTSYVSVQMSTTPPTCGFNNPWATSFGYVNWVISHKLACPSGEVTLETQYLYGSWENACGSPETPECHGAPEYHVQDNGSTWHVETLTKNAYRTVVGGEFSCGYYHTGWGGVGFTKVTAPDGCP
jgi:hypothetical protein